MSSNEYMLEYINARYIKLKLKAIKYKGGSCIKCGYKDCYAALDFHHRNPQHKEFSWKIMRRRSWKAVIKELNKCDLLCCRCHREVHFDKTISDKYLKLLKSKETNRLQKVVKKKKCPNCNKNFKSRRNSTKYCSYKCSVDGRIKIKWPQNLPELVKHSSRYKVAKSLGVSYNMLKKRLRNHHGEQTRQAH